MAMAGASAAALFLAAGGAQAGCASVAGDVLWNVSGTFTDGGTLGGCFYINVYGNLDTSAPWALTTTTGSSLPGYTYDTSDSYIISGTDFVDVEPGYTQDLRLTFTDPLTAPGPSNAIVTASSYECIGSYSCYVPSGGTDRYLESGGPGGGPVGSGSTPEPVSWVMMITGLALVGGMMRARRHAARVAA